MASTTQENLSTFFNDLFGDGGDDDGDDDDDDIDKIKWVTAFSRLQINMAKKDIIKIFDCIDEEQSGYIDRFDFMDFCNTSDFEDDPKQSTKHLQHTLITQIEAYLRFKQIGDDESIEIVYSHYTVNPCKPISVNDTHTKSVKSPLLSPLNSAGGTKKLKRHTSSLNFTQTANNTHDAYYNCYYDDELFHEKDTQRIIFDEHDNCLCCSKCGKQFIKYVVWKKHESKCKYNAEQYIAYLLTASEQDTDISFLTDREQKTEQESKQNHLDDANLPEHVQTSSATIPPPPSQQQQQQQTEEPLQNGYHIEDIPPPPAMSPPPPPPLLVPPPPPIEEADIIRYNANEMSEILSQIPDKVPIWSRLFISSTSNEHIADRIQTLRKQPTAKSYIKCIQSSAYKDYRDTLQQKMVDLLLSTHEIQKHPNFQFMQQPQQERSLRSISINVLTPSDRKLIITNTETRERELSEPVKPNQESPIHRTTQNEPGIGSPQSVLNTMMSLQTQQSSKIRYHHNLSSNKVTFRLQESKTELTDTTNNMTAVAEPALSGMINAVDPLTKGEESDVDDYDAVRVSDTVDDTDFHRGRDSMSMIGIQPNLMKAKTQPLSDNEVEQQIIKNKNNNDNKPVRQSFLKVFNVDYSNAEKFGAPRSKSSFNLKMSAESVQEHKEKDKAHQMTNTLQIAQMQQDHHVATLKAINSAKRISAGNVTVDSDDSLSSSLSDLDKDSKLDKVKQDLESMTMGVNIPRKNADADVSERRSLELLSLIDETKLQQEHTGGNSSDEEVSSLPSATDDEDEKEQKRNSNVFGKEEIVFNPLARKSGYRGSVDSTYTTHRSSMSVNPLSSPKVDHIPSIPEAHDEDGFLLDSSPLTPLDRTHAYSFSSLKRQRMMSKNSNDDEEEDEQTASGHHERVIALILEFAGIVKPVYLDGYLMLHQMVYDIYTRQYNDIWYKYRLPIWLKLLFDQQRINELEKHYKATSNANNFENGKLKWVYSLHDMIYYDQTLFTHLLHTYGIPPSLQSLIWYHLSHNHHIQTDLDMFPEPLVWNQSGIPLIDEIMDTILRTNYVDNVQITLMTSYVFQPFFHHNGQPYESRRIMNSKNKRKLLPNWYYPQYRDAFLEETLYVLLGNVWTAFPMECQKIMYDFVNNMQEQSNAENHQWLFAGLDVNGDEQMLNGMLHKVLFSDDSLMNDCQFVLAVYLWDGMLGIVIWYTAMLLSAIHSYNNNKEEEKERDRVPLMFTEMPKLRKVYKFVYDFIVNQSDYDNENDSCLSLTVIKQLCGLPSS